MDNKYKTTNTFSQQPSLAQIVAYLVFLSESIVFYAVAAPNFNTEASQITLIVLYSISLIMVLVFTIISSVVDPSD